MAHTRRILVVDDQRLDRVIATHAATKAGFEATGASGLRETRELLEQGSRFGFVMIDLSLGEEDGLEVLPLVARYNREAVVLLASGFDARVLNASQRIAASLGLTVAGVLRKPIMPDSLVQLLRQAPRPGKIGQAANRAMTPAEIRLAIADQAIRTWFQPKVSLATGAVVGAEALARWITPDGPRILPSAFIQVAEENGLIGSLTDLVLGQSLIACAGWRAAGSACRVAVNLSPLLLNDPDLTDRIERLMQAHGVPANALVLEITEGSSIPTTAMATKTLTRLRIRGVSLSIDDFGTGHSSLLSLARMPFNEMKIDQAFVQEAVSNPDFRKVVRASASLGRELGMTVVAEGVENDQAARLVTEAGCDIGQGWLYGRAVPAETFLARMADAPATVTS